MKLHALRLEPGDDLRLSLEEFTQKSGISAGFIAGAVGSLQRARLRFADAGMPTLVAGPLEILSLSGTLSPDGAHLHLSASNAQGGILGGHVMSGCMIHTTAELVIGEATAMAFKREPDAKTGYRELVVSPRPD